VVGDVIIWSGEDGHSVLAARLAAMNADMSRIHFVGDVTAAKGVDFDPRTQMDLLEATASKLAAPCLFIIDPIVSAVKGDGNNSPEVRQSLRPVVALGQRLDCAVLGITHFSKGTEDRDPVERVTGSIGFVALARLVLVASKVAAANDMESRNVMVRAKANIGPDDGGFAYTLDRMTVAPDVEGQRVVWGEALIGTARDLLADRTNAGRATNEIDIFINDLLGDGPMLVKTIKEEAKEAGYSWRTVQDRSKRLNVITKKGGMAGGWTWSLGTTPEGARGGAP
jgi:putative DNA primase/helicase